MKVKHGSTAYLVGKGYKIEYQPHKMMKPRVVLLKKKIKVYRGETSRLTHKAVFTEWLKTEAETYIASRCRRLAKKHEFEFNRLSIKDQKTRWGSCSSKKNLNFNIRLMLTPKKVIDYVIIHELCHLKQMNHSARFWNLVESIMPDYMVWEKWLSVEGKNLF